MNKSEFVDTGPLQPGDAVRSLQFGLGRDAIGGDDPAVRFLCGIERLVPNETLDIVPEQKFCDTVASTAAVELVTHRWATDAGTAKWMAFGIRRQLGGFHTDDQDEIV
ncbi:MAG TPA: hypothetical protein PKN33_03195 [Phycisphaerae bacterium]|nr:hypothetical protein [Phycisphaerae bacterium]